MMKKNVLLFYLLAASTAFAQKTHTVIKGDTPYNVSKKYGMSLEELYKLNPSTKEGSFKIGDVLAIKSNGAGASTSTLTASKTVTSSAGVGKIVLKPKQTIYGITKQYKITEAELRKLNPNLDQLNKIGDELILPLDAIKKYGDEGATQVVSTTTEVKQSSTPVSTSENTYQVQEKDNYYKITRKFNLSQKELFALNPGLEEKGLQPGDQIIVVGKAEEISSKPSKSTQIFDKTEPAKAAVSTDDFVTYTVQNGDTVFGILNRFGVTLDQLMELNPELSNGLKSGMVLKIKKMDAAYVKKSGDALNIVLMLPFGFNSSDTKYRSLASDFLSGAKLAIDKNAEKGLKMDVTVIDAGNESSFKNALIQINPENTDLIIGPFFKSNVVDVLDFVKKDKIPVVAPFANSEDLYDYNNLIIVETSEKTYAERIAKEVKEAYENQKIVVVSGNSKDNANYLKELLEKQIKGAEVAIVGSASEVKLDQNMMTGQAAPIIAVLATDTDAVGEAFGNKMIELSKVVSGNRAFSMFHSPIFEKKTDELSQVNLVYLQDRKINQDGSFEKQVLASFKQKYCKTPTKYQIIGFDVVNDILSRENKKGEIFKQMNKSQTQLATKFEYERAKTNGAYINKGYRVVRLIP